jgi:hypothetical protein
VFDWVMEVFFCLDIVRNFFMQYEDFEERKTIRDLKLIAKRYLKGVFLFDMLAIFHYVIYEICKRTDIDQDQLYLLYLLRLLRLPKTPFFSNA